MSKKRRNIEGLDWLETCINVADLAFEELFPNFHSTLIHRIEDENDANARQWLDRFVDSADAAFDEMCPLFEQRLSQRLDSEKQDATRQRTVEEGITPNYQCKDYFDLINKLCVISSSIDALNSRNDVIEQNIDTLNKQRKEQLQSIQQQLDKHSAILDTHQELMMLLDRTFRYILSQNCPKVNCQREIIFKQPQNDFSVGQSNNLTVKEKDYC